MGSRPQNIAYILPWPTVGGTETATLRIIRGVEGDEFRSTAFHLPDAEAVRAFFASAGVETAEYRPA